MHQSKCSVTSYYNFQWPKVGGSVDNRDTRVYNKVTYWIKMNMNKIIHRVLSLRNSMPAVLWKRINKLHKIDVAYAQYDLGAILGRVCRLLIYTKWFITAAKNVGNVKCWCLFFCVFCVNRIAQNVVDGFFSEFSERNGYTNTWMRQMVKFGAKVGGNLNMDSGIFYVLTLAIAPPRSVNRCLRKGVNSMSDFYFDL